MVPVTIDPAGTPTIGSYRLVSRLGAGGMGEVWIGEHQLIGRRAAIKVLLPRVSRQPEVVERFFAEARATSKISDPGIVHVYDFGWHGDDAYIAMELLEGEVLSARVAREGRLPIATALRLAHQIAVTMAVAHARGIVHRDLKPDNLFVVADAVVHGGERVKILDFGIAKLLGDDLDAPTRTQSGVLLGTPTYMSPEQCRGSANVDHRTDIYALGCILFVLLVGRPPFVKESAGDMIASHLMEEPSPPSEHGLIPPGIDALVLRCLAKEMNERFADMTELAAALASLGDQLTEPTPPVRRSQPLRPTGDGRRAVGVGELPTLLPTPRRGRLRWFVLALLVSGVALALVRMRAGHPEDIQTNDQTRPSLVPRDASTRADDSQHPITDGREIEVAIPSVVDGGPHGPRRAPRRDAASGSAASYQDP